MSMLSELGGIIPALKSLGGISSFGFGAFLAFKFVQWVTDTFHGRADKREADLMQKEADYRSRTDAQLQALVLRVDRMERDNDVLFSVVSSILDRHPVGIIGRQLRAAYPVPTEMPPRMAALLARLETQEHNQVN